MPSSNSLVASTRPEAPKTYLHHIFEKTGAERQADLVRLVAGYSSPLDR